MKRIGILGGTFDPLHKGHIELAQLAGDEEQLDEVWLVPAFYPAHKDAVTPYALRMAMTKAGAQAAQDKRLKVKGLEEDLPTPTRTVNLLRKLRAENPDDEIYYIIGQDTLESMGSWVEPEECLTLAKFLVISRWHVKGTVPGWVPDGLAKNISFHDSKLYQVSSTMLREAASRGQKRKELYDAVWLVIEENQLYGAGKPA